MHVLKLSSLQVTAAEPGLPAATQVDSGRQAAPRLQPAAAAVVPVAQKPVAVSRPSTAMDHASYYLQVLNCSPCKLCIVCAFNTVHHHAAGKAV